jgi:nucleoside-diphosphate-sugar epimerase
MGRDKSIKDSAFIISRSDSVLVTGANGFIGAKVVQTLLEYGFNNIKCLVRSSGNLTLLKKAISINPAKVELITGDLLSPEDCNMAIKDSRLVYHLAAVMRDTVFESSHLNNVQTTINLLNGIFQHDSVRRFVNVSSFVVYSNMNLHRGALLDETCEREPDPVGRGDAYCNSKILQEDWVVNKCKQHGLSHVIVRPAIVYGPDHEGIHRMVGRSKDFGPFRVFMHLGGSNILPLSYVDNCAEAIVLAGLKSGVDGEVFNVVDDDLITSREFISQYKRNVKKILSINLSFKSFYIFSCCWEVCFNKINPRLSKKFNRKKASHYYKGNQYSNAKLKKLLGWEPKVARSEALNRYFEYQKLFGNDRELKLHRKCFVPDANKRPPNVNM